MKNRADYRMLSSLALGVLLAAAILGISRSGAAFARDEAALYHCPQDLAFSPDGSTLAVADQSGRSLWLVAMEAPEDARPIRLEGEVESVVFGTDGGRLYASESGHASVAEIDAISGSVLRRFAVGLYPRGLALAAGRGELLVANAARGDVSVVDLKSGLEKARLPVAREPHSIAVTTDESLALVTNLLPAGRADAPDYGAVVTLLDLTAGAAAGDITLPPGSSGVREVAIGPHGRFAYATHIVGRTGVPATQLERGWVNTNALSILDLEQRSVYATVLLDHPLEGAADPWGLALAADGSTLWVALSGVHQVARIDLKRLHRYAEGGLPEDHPLAQAAQYAPGSESIWLQIQRDPARRAELVNDLAALYAADLATRLPVPGQGPRGLALSAAGDVLAVAMYFAGEVALVDTSSGAVATRIPLGQPREPDLAQRGRMVFHDGTLCFQNWLSCATCHPNDGRVDGLNWDLPNDGLGNPKNNKSLLLVGDTPPFMWRGVRPDFETAVAKGFHFLMRQPEPGETEAVQAYLKSLQPLPSPYRKADGSLSAAAERGRLVFESEDTECASCHPAPLFTDLDRHDVSTMAPFDHTDRFDTPTLVELYRTGPYLHDGSAATLREVLVERNAEDGHGLTSILSEAQLQDLIAYLLSL